MTRAERYEQIKVLRESEGLKFREIAERLGISTSLANDIYLDPAGEKARARKAKRFGYCADCGVKVTNAGSEPPDRCFGCRMELQESWDYRIKMAERPRNRKWSDEAILDAMRSAATNGTVTKAAYDEIYARCGKRIPSSVTIMWRFGKWNTALEAAGLRVSQPKANYRGTLTQEGALLAVLDCADELGKVPTQDEYGEWAQGKDVPSAVIIRVRWGTWFNVAQAAHAEVETAQAA